VQQRVRILRLGRDLLGQQAGEHCYDRHGTEHRCCGPSAGGGSAQGAEASTGVRVSGVTEKSGIGGGGREHETSSVPDNPNRADDSITI
jgi:hypothetical protein